jgi:hypothetical protein
MTAPLTPESEALLERIHSLNGRSFPLATRKDFVAIEAAAIARYAEGLVEVVARGLWAAAGGSYRWEEHLPEARRLLAIPEAQEADRGPLVHQQRGEP